MDEVVFRFPVRVYWEDTDAGGVVFYANYLKFFERARTEWLRSRGFGQQDLRERAGLIFVVTDSTVRYRQPARLEASGRASLIIAQQALRADTGALLCEGTIRIGWVDAATLKPGRIPAAVLDVLKTKE